MEHPTAKICRSWEIFGAGNETSGIMAVNYKGMLQELFQKNQEQCRSPEYKEIENIVDPLMPVHTILLTAVWKGKELNVIKSARRKIDAEKEAAKEMYEMILQGGPASNAPSCSSFAPAVQDGGSDNAKNELQEVVQKSGHPVPSYELLFKGGPPHQPVFRVVVKTPWDGRVLAEEGQGNTRKAAEKNAAERLLQRICGRKQLPLLPPLEEGCDASSDAEDVSTSAKSKLQELLQKRRYPLPAYELTGRDGPSHQPTFTVTITVRNKAKKILYTKEASASQRKEAEKLCAKLALPDIEFLLGTAESDDDEEFEMPQHSPAHSTDPPPSLGVKMDWDLDKDQLRRLARFTGHPPAVFCEAGEDGTTLCLVSVKARDDSWDVTAQGSGTTPSDAVRCGMDNLIHHMGILYPAARTQSGRTTS